MSTNFEYIRLTESNLRGELSGWALNATMGSLKTDGQREIRCPPLISLAWSLWPGHPGLCWVEVVRVGIPVSVLRWEASCFTVESEVSCGPVTYSLHHGEAPSSCTSLVESFIMKACWVLSSALASFCHSWEQNYTGSGVHTAPFDSRGGRMKNQSSKSWGRLNIHWKVL